MHRLLLLIAVILSVSGLQAQGVTDYTTPDDALIFTAPDGYTMEVTDAEAMEAMGFSFDAATTPLRITLEPVDGMTANISITIFYGQPLDSFFGQFISMGLDEPVTPSESSVEDVLRSIGIAFEMAAAEDIVIESMTLADGTEIAYYDYIGTVTDEELGEIDLGGAMDDIMGSAEDEVDDAGASDALGELFDNVESPFGQGMFESISETTRYYGLSFENTGPVIIEATIGSTIEGGEGALGGMNDFMAALDGDIPAVMELFVNNVQAGTGEPIYVEEGSADEATDETTAGSQQTGDFAYTPPPGYAVLQAEDGEIILSNDPNGSVDDQMPAAGTVQIGILYGDPLLDNFAESGMMFSNATDAATQLATLFGTSPTPTTIGATETQNVTFDAGMFVGSYYLFEHPAVGTVLVAATADTNDTLSAAQRDIILLIVSMQ